MKKNNFDNLTEQEKFDLVETYLKTKKSITGMDIVTCLSMLGVAGSIWGHALTNEEFFKYAPLSLVPIFAFMAYKKIKLSKKYKKVSGNKVNYAKIRKTEISGELGELTSKFSPEERARRATDNLAKLLGVNISKNPYIIPIPDEDEIKRNKAKKKQAKLQKAKQEKNAKKEEENENKK